MSASKNRDATDRNSIPRKVVACHRAAVLLIVARESDVVVDHDHKHRRYLRTRDIAETVQRGSLTWRIGAAQLISSGMFAGSLYQCGNNYALVLGRRTLGVPGVEDFGEFATGLIERLSPRLLDLHAATCFADETIARMLTGAAFACCDLLQYRHIQYELANPLNAAAFRYYSASFIPRAATGAGAATTAERRLAA